MSENKKGSQCIECNVASCMHNNVEHCSCLLESIQVCPCRIDIEGNTPDSNTACLSYKYVGRENIYGSKNY